MSSFAAQSQCYQNVTFEEWETTGDSTSGGGCNGGGWVLGAGDSSLSSTCNSLFPLMYVGPDTLINVKITGTFEVATNSDDDYVGFVFGFQDTWDYTWSGGTGDTMYHDYYLFDWKKNGQTWSGYTAQEGYSLCKVDTALARTNAQVFPNFWNHANSAGFQVLQTQFSTTSGWVSYTEYDFELYYTPTRAVITIDTDTIFDQSGCFEPGLFGFYSFSQQGTDYWDFNYELFIDFGMESQSVCLGDSSHFIFIDTGTCYSANTYTNLDTFYWDLGDGTFTNDTNPNHLYDSAAAYTVNLIATDINGCTDTATNIVWVHAPPVSNILADNVCKGDSAHFADSTTMPYGFIQEWNWTFGDGNTNTTSGTPVHLYNQSGIYNIELIVTDNAGCMDTTESTIEVYANPEPYFSSIYACDGHAVELNDSSLEAQASIVNYEWDVENNGSVDYTADSVAHVYNSHGTYAVQFTVFDSLGCRDSITDLITVFPFPNADFEVPSVCFNETSQFYDSSTVATGQFTDWLWDFGDGTTSTNPNPNHTYLFSGNQTVNLKVTSVGGCQDSVTKSILVYHLPVAVFEPDSQCENLAHSFIQNSTSQSGVISSWEWDYGDGNNAIGSGPLHDYDAPGLYPVELIVTTQYGCKDTVVENIRILPAPDASFNWQNNVCEGDPLPFYDKSSVQQITPGGDQIVSWDWDINGKADPSQNPVYTTSLYETLDVFLLVSTNYGCVDSTRNYPQIYPIPEPAFSEDMGCAQRTSAFQDDSKIATGLIEEWQWDFGDGNTADSANPDHTFQSHGDYLVSLIVTSNKGCVKETEHSVHVHETPKVDFLVDPEIGCTPFEPQAINLSTISIGELAYEWRLDGDLFSDSKSPKLLVINDTLAPKEFIVSLKAISDEGCTAVKRVDETFYSLPSPKAKFGFSDKSIDLFEQAILFENKSENSVRWLWDFNDGQTSTNFSPEHQFENSGEYFIQLTSWNEFNCFDTIVRYIEIEPVTSLYIPTGFTPNGDGHNEVWSIAGFNEGNHFEIRIWDRWGHVIKEGKGLNFTWDGTLPNGQKAPTGSYVYDIIYETSDGAYKELSGKVALLR